MSSSMHCTQASNYNMTDNNQIHLPPSLNVQQAAIAGTEKLKKEILFWSRIILGKGPNVLADLSESIKNDPALAHYFHDSEDFEIEWFCSLLNDDATDLVDGIQSVMEKTLSGNCERLENERAACLSAIEGHYQRIGELEGERAKIAMDLKNIHTFPELSGMYQQLEEMRSNLAAFKSAVTEKEQKLSSKKRKELEEKVQQQKHECDELTKEVKQSDILEETLTTEKRVMTKKLLVIMNCQKHAMVFNTFIGCSNDSSAWKYLTCDKIR